MNANELADEIKKFMDNAESYYGEAEKYLNLSIQMLKKQESHINALYSQLNIAHTLNDLLRKAQEK